MTPREQVSAINSQRNALGPIYRTALRFQDVVRKARFGHREWIWWKDKTGVACASRLTHDAMKRCLLDVGTSGKWTLLCADGTCMCGYFWLGIIQLSRIRHGLLHGAAYTEDRVMRLGR